MFSDGLRTIVLLTNRTKYYFLDLLLVISSLIISIFQRNELSLQRIAKIIGTKKIGIMENPFKFGTVVDSPYFTDRVEELSIVKQTLNSHNHLVVISPRRFGKTSLVRKAVVESSKPYIFINMQQVTNMEDFAAMLLKGVFRIHPIERIRHLFTNFRVVPTISSNPITNSIEVSFQPTFKTDLLIEDALGLVEKVGDADCRMVVVLDEFQEIIGLEKNIDKKLRAIMQEQQCVNYVFLGSQESKMTQIFERKKSPFYHFGRLMRLEKIPRTDFFNYITSRLDTLTNEGDAIADVILDETDCHPYYTQQVSSVVWDMLYYQKEKTTDVVAKAINQLVITHDLDFERLWLTFNKTDRKMLQLLCKGQSPYEQRQIPTSTSFSALKRLMQDGFVIRTDTYLIEDPIFRHWIKGRMDI